jgi:hypothetical protein
MKCLISHRGNIRGPNTEKENSPSYIMETLNLGFDVEIDVWFIDNQFYLGHDKFDYKIDKSFLINPKLWCHAKNIDALNEMLKVNIHCFWHQVDDVVLTSKQFIWTYPGRNIAKTKAIAVMPEIVKDWDISNAYGICSDYISKY